MAIGPDFLDGMDDTEDEDEPPVANPLAVGGMASDLAVQYADYNADLRKNATRAQEIRRQQLQQATEMLRARRYEPSLSERLFQISAAFAQPTRSRGFAPVLNNVMTTLAQQAAARRVGRTARDEDLLALQSKYALGDIEDERENLKLRGQALRSQATAMKPQKRRLDVLGRGFIDEEDGTITPFGAVGPTPGHIAALRQHPERAADFDIKFGPGAAARILGQGGATGAAPSGSFRP